MKIKCLIGIAMVGMLFFAACGGEVMEILPPVLDEPEYIASEPEIENESEEEFETESEPEYEPEPEPEQIIIMETSFETGYDGIEPLGDSVIIERSSFYVRTGNYSLMVAGRTHDSHGIVLDVTDFARHDGLYEFSLWTFNPSHMPITFQLVAISGESHVTMNGNYSELTVRPGGWVQLVGYMPANLPDGSGLESVSLQTRGDAVATFFVDDVTVVLKD